ncbi:MAG TPA: hypothetical protein VKT81_22605, partial [Bryobacteraceae bacterium]|nr:hypothetical protein [Bryobacteraceae bacterium]
MPGRERAKVEQLEARRTDRHGRKHFDIHAIWDHTHFLGQNLISGHQVPSRHAARSNDEIRRAKTRPFLHRDFSHQFPVVFNAWISILQLDGRQPVNLKDQARARREIDQRQTFEDGAKLNRFERFISKPACQVTPEAEHAVNECRAIARELGVKHIRPALLWIIGRFTLRHGYQLDAAEHVRQRPGKGLDMR